MKKVLAISILGILMFGFSALAFDPNSTGLTNTATAAGYDTGKTDLVTMIGTIINAALGLIGLVLMILIVISGIMWMIAGDVPANVQKAKDMMKNAIIGVVIIAISYTASTYIFNLIIKIQGS